MDARSRPSAAGESIRANTRAVKADKENNTNESEYTFDLFHDKVLSLCVKYAGQAPSGVPGHRCAGPALCPYNSIPKITVYGKQNLVYN